ncbi:MAG: hypothetical protein CAPSK01_002541 [Candidatus Accumulibacter vicinus]|uniref:Uncharacterized protein n=2 Tax=Candidatus Accumulibacter vicinus TaxID=2954382 RepID=A0A084XZQ8_9PROT|nr:MAG: hypothetical protein CAPSK01_002541 [Candidatus Accumulibacter vicinus]
MVGMDLSSVFSKTPKGIEEISTRANRLPFRMRAMLIMVDGQRTGNQLLAFGASATESAKQLAALLDGGFVQVQAPVHKIAEAVVQPLPADREDISLAKSYTVRALQELLGSQADALIAEIEQAKTAADLRQKVGKLRAALRAAPDQKKAKQFLVKLAMVLD